MPKPIRLSMSPESIRRISLPILVSLAYGTPINFKEIYTEGITEHHADRYRLRERVRIYDQVAGYRETIDGEIEARVHPTMLPATSPIAQVEGVYNAIQLVGDAVGDVVLYGRGAGSMPTGSAVVSDVIAIGAICSRASSDGCRLASFQQDQTTAPPDADDGRNQLALLPAVYSGRSTRCVGTDRR